MVVRLILFVVFYLGILIVPGAGIAYIAYKALQPRLERRKQIRAARRRAETARRLLTACNDEHKCCFCFHPTSMNVDAYSDELGWHHVNCMQKELQ